MGSQRVAHDLATEQMSFCGLIVPFFFSTEYYPVGVPWWLSSNLPVLQETWVQSLGWEDPLEKGMATHSSTLVWRTPWTEEPGRIQSTGSQRVRHDWSGWAHLHKHYSIAWIDQLICPFAHWKTSWLLLDFYYKKTPVGRFLCGH